MKFTARPLNSLNSLSGTVIHRPVSSAVSAGMRCCLCCHEGTGGR